MSTTFKGLTGDVSPGDPILIDDGKVLVRVVEVQGTDVITRVEVPGTVSNNKGLNLPGVAVSVPALSDKDETDLRWGLAQGCDFIALSFVRSAQDYDRVRQIMEEEGRVVPVIAKIEKPQPSRTWPRSSRRSTASWSPVVTWARAAARAGAARAEARGRARPPQREAGHRRDAGARVHDDEPAPDARRGVRLRQRGARRCGCRHALG